MRPSFVLRSAASAAVLAGAALGFAAPAFAAAQTGSAAGMTFDLGPSPVGLPANCPFANGDANFVFESGTVVMHDTSNANGDWGGQTMEGTAVFYEGTTPLYAGHLTVWEGGGNNAQAQTEGGITIDFGGTGDSGTLQIHVNGHTTTKAKQTNGQPVVTANIINVGITCG